MKIWPLTKSDILETTLPIALVNVCTTPATVLEPLMYTSTAAGRASGGTALVVSITFFPGALNSRGGPLCCRVIVDLLLLPVGDVFCRVGITGTAADYG